MIDIEKLIREKEFSDKKQRRITLFFIIISLLIIVIIFIITTNTRNTNIVLTQKLDTVQVINNSMTKKLNDTLLFFSKELNKDFIECTGVSTDKKSSKGLPLYDFTMKISDTLLNLSLKRVEYYFSDDTFNPKLKSSDNQSEYFRINITNCWGCMPIVPVYLYFKNNNIDTVLFPMCKKAILELPEFK